MGEGGWGSHHQIWTTSCTHPSFPPFSRARSRSVSPHAVCAMPPPPAASASSAPSSAGAATAAIDELFAHLPFAVGRDLSVRDRESRGVDDLRDAPALAYGETPLSTVAAALQRIETLSGRIPRGLDFLDVGSGTGKPSFAAALLFPAGTGVWRRCVGVELLPSLFSTSLEVLEAWEGGLPFLERGRKETQYRVPADARRVPVHFFLGDAFGDGPLVSMGGDDSPVRPKTGGEGAAADASTAAAADPTPSSSLPPPSEDEGLDWSRVGVAYACSTCFDEETMKRLGKRARAMRPGSYFVTASVTLPTAAGGGGAAGEGTAEGGEAAGPAPEAAVSEADAEWDVVAVLTGLTMSWSTSTTVYVQRRRG